jgi:hypothetical protein
MSAIPILYTGKEAARFNWNALGENMRDSYRRIRENAISQQRYDDIQAQKERQMILNETDVDRMSFGNEQVQAIETKMYDDFLGKATTLVNEKIKRQGKLSTEDYLTLRTMANKYGRDMQSYKASEQRRSQDYAIATDPKNIKKFDQQKVKENIAYWDYRNGMYPKDALDSALRELTESELIAEDAKLATDPNVQATRFGDLENIDGEQYRAKVQEKYDSTYYQPIDDGKGNKVVALKDQEAIGFIKDNYTIGGREQNFASVNKLFQKQDPIKQQAYINKYGDDAQIAWWTLDDPERTKKLFPLVTETSQVKSTTSGDGSKNTSGQKVPVLTDSRTLDIGGITYDNVYSFTEAVNIPTFKAVGVQRVKDGKLSKSSDEPETIKGNLSDVIVEDGKITKFVIEQPVEKFKTNIDGEPLYSLAGYGEGTLTELKAMTDAKGKNWSIDRIKAGADPIKTTGGTETIILPASKNKVLKEKFNIPNVNQIGESKEKTKSYTIKGKPFTEDQVKVAAEKSGMTIEEYIQKANK